MKVEDLPALDAKNADPLFKTFAGDDLPERELRQAMIDDVLGLLGYYTWTEPAGVDELFDQRAVVRASDARLGELYGVAAVGRQLRAARACPRASAPAC